MNISEIKSNIEGVIVRNLATLNALSSDRDNLRTILSKLDTDIDNLKASNAQLEYIRDAIKNIVIGETSRSPIAANTTSRSKLATAAAARDAKEASTRTRLTRLRENQADNETSSSVNRRDNTDDMVTDALTAYFYDLLEDFL